MTTTQQMQRLEALERAASAKQLEEMWERDAERRRAQAAELAAEFDVRCGVCRVSRDVTYARGVVSPQLRRSLFPASARCPFPGVSRARRDVGMCAAGERVSLPETQTGVGIPGAIPASVLCLAHAPSPHAARQSQCLCRMHPSESDPDGYRFRSLPGKVQ